jgi:hypothetical protein
MPDLRKEPQMPENHFTTGPESETTTEVTPGWRLVERPGRSGGDYVEIAISGRTIRNINMTNLDVAHQNEVIALAGQFGDPTVEEWTDLRALAADRRLSSAPLLVDGINSRWSADFPLERPHRLTSIVAELVEERLLSKGNVEMGEQSWNLFDLVAREVLALKTLIPRDVTRPLQAIGVLIARLTGLVEWRTFVPREDEEHLPGKDEPAFAYVEARATIEAIASHLEQFGDVPSTIGARFLRQPDLWDLSRSEQASALGVSPTAWRQAWHRVVVRLRASEVMA